MNMPMDIDSLVETVSSVLTARKPVRVRQLDFFSTNDKSGKMGHEGANLNSFMDNLHNDMSSAHLEQMRFE